MGKSPGKWIKTVLLGKKQSKSNLSKGAKVEKCAVPEQPEENLNSGLSVVAETPYLSSERSDADTKSEKVIQGSVSCESAASLPVQEQTELHNVVGLRSSDEEETAKLEQAATKAQAAFRGYLARRAFWALKGITRLQALIRGHLVRRQAVATLYCLHSVVRLQALARGRMVRISYPGLELSTKGRVQDSQDAPLLVSAGITTAFRSQKLSANAFARKLLSLLPKAMALSLHYGPDEPNAAWMWLERWSLLHFWEPLAPSKVVVDVKALAKQVNTSTVVGEKGKSRRTFRKVAGGTAGENAILSSSELDKPKRNPRRLASHQTESSQEQPQSELEKVKRSLRKVSASATASAEKSEAENGKHFQTPGKSSNSSPADLSEPGIINLPEQPIEPNFVVDNLAEAENISKPLKADEPIHLLPSDVSVTKQNSVENGTEAETDGIMNGELTKKEDQTEKENQKTLRRRSLPAKHEYNENMSHNTASIPSYMAATESAKAKLRLQASVKSSEDGIENGVARRQSLPVSTNGKFSSSSPRVQKPAQVTSKGVIKNNKSLSSSRDERVLQPGWRR